MERIRRVIHGLFTGAGPPSANGAGGQAVGNATPVRASRLLGNRRAQCRGVARQRSQPFQLYVPATELPLVVFHQQQSADQPHDGVSWG